MCVFFFKKSGLPGNALTCMCVGFVFNLGFVISPVVLFLVGHTRAVQEGAGCYYFFAHRIRISDIVSCVRNSFLTYQRIRDRVIPM